MAAERPDASVQTITADDVAEAAGVSRWTVSRAFKKDASISERTRTKVLAAAEAVGYLPDLQAASLGSDRSNLVALLIDDFNNPHKLIMLERLTRVLRANGYDTLLVNTLDGTETNNALQTASQRRVDAAIVIGIQFSDAVLDAASMARRIRKLIIFARNSEKPNTISISVDDQAAMATMTDYVLSKGYRVPLFLAGPDTRSAHVQRQETFRARWQGETGRMPDVLPIGAYDSLRAYERTVAHLKSLPRENWPDILVCENDAIAMGALDAVRKALGLSVPGDIAVTGFDDVPQAAHPAYDLTTYRQPITRMAEHLVGILENTQNASSNDAFLGHIVVRGSA